MTEKAREYEALFRKCLDKGRDMVDISFYYDALSLCEAILKEGSMIVFGNGKNTQDREILDDESKALAISLVRELRAMAKEGIREGLTDGDYEELYWKTYLFEAPHVFDAFMLYIEHGRPPHQQYWLPRRDSLLHVCETLQSMEDGKLDELFLSMPPRVGKTTIMVFFSLWVILKDSERSNLYVSYTQSVVDVFYNGLLEILNDPYTYLWKDVFPRASIASTDAKDLLINIDRKKRYASFTCRSLYGTLNGACDCNGYQLADDTISGIEEAMSKDRLDASYLKIENNYLPRGKEGSKRIWIGTRWAQGDSQGRRLALLESDDRFSSVRWKSINVPALNENDESNFGFRFGVGFSTDYYKQRRAAFERNNDMPSWLAQYQGVPVDRAGSVFEPEDLRYFNGVLPEGVEPDRIYMAVDPAWGGGDHVASPVCIQYGMDIYVVDAVYNNADKTVTQPLIVAMAEKYGVSAITCEGTRATSSYAEDISHRLKEKGLRVNVQSSVKNWTFTGKEQRIFDKAPDIREHMVFLSANRSKEYEMFMQNVFAFKIGSKNKHGDDAPDSLAMAIQMATTVREKAVIIRRQF